jgi:hypothetical protein
VRLVLLVAALFCAFLTGNHIAHPFIDGDLFWQRFLGAWVLSHHAIPATLGTDVFSAVGAPWTPQEWFFSIIVALTFQHALWVVMLMTGLAVLAALMLMALRAKRAGASMFSVMAVLLFAGICMEASFSARAQVWAWPLFAALLVALDEDGPGLWWAIPITIAWANVHASVMLAVPIVWLDAALYAWKRYAGGDPLLGQREINTRLLLCTAVPIAILCTPLGVRLPLYAFHTTFNSSIRVYINEWQPLRGLGLANAVGLLPLAALSLYGATRVWKDRPRDAALPLLMIVWAVMAVRNIPLFAIAAAVPASLAIEAGEGWANPVDRLRHASMATLAALVVAVPLAGFIGYRASPIFMLWPAPFGSMAKLAAQPGDQRLLCSEYSWCAMALGDKNVRIFLDGRADPYPRRVWDAYMTFTRMLPGWQRVLTDNDVNAVLAWRGGQVEAKMQKLAGWHELSDTGDPCCVLFLRSIPVRTSEK